MCDTFHLFFTLPEEISMYILTFLSAADLCSAASGSHAMKRIAHENMLWRKLCKKNQWVAARDVVHETPLQFDYKRFFTDRTLISKTGAMKWLEASKVHGTAPTKRFKHSATVVGKHLIFIGGQETDTKRFNEIIYFDTESKTFSQPTIKGDKVPSFSRHSASLVGSKIYVFGGFDGHGTNFDLAVFDPYTRIWTNVTKTQVRGVPPTSRTNHASAAVGKNLFVFGGNNNSEAGRYQVLDDLTVLNTQTMTWVKPKVSGAIPCARSGHTLTAIGKKLYLFGGGVWNETQGWVDKFNDVHVLDTETMNWTKPVCQGTINTSTFPISYAVGRFLFVFGGGSKSEQSVTSDLYMLDTVTFNWSMITAAGTAPQPRDMGTASVVGDYVYFYGGYAGEAKEYFDKMQVQSGSKLSIPSF